MRCEHTRQVVKNRLLYPQYLARFCYRAGMFLAVLVCYFRAPERLDLTQPWGELGPASPACLLMLSMTVVMFAQNLRGPGMSMGRLKQYPDCCDIDPNYDPRLLKAARRTLDRGALKVLILWLAANGVVAALYFRQVLGAAELVLLSAFYYLSDMICILFFCPFQLIMGNQCCVNCRLFAWGAWMMATPLVLLPTPLVLGPVVLSLLLLLRWEVHYRQHPEQFWRGSNRSLRCVRCTDHLCRCKLYPKPGFR